MKVLKNTTYQKEKTNVGHDSMFDTQKVKRKSEQLFFTSERYRRKKIAIQEMHCNQKETFCMDNEPLQRATEKDWNLLQ